MNYYSTNQQSPKASFREAAIKGQPPDKGLYFPERIPILDAGLLQDIKRLSREEIALEIIRPYTGDSIPGTVLKDIIAQTINFEFPLVQVEEDVYSLELFHGPTLAFKDVGARFMSRCLEYFARNNDHKMVVLTATSGDTGGAVADGFYKTDGIEVVILYPSGKVSSVQELQLTRLGHNIHALEVNGSFDDCQRLVKQAFADRPLNEAISLTSANSINIARWLPQQFYYFFALQQWPHAHSPVISVPSGNFGNLCAGLLAYRSGLPVQHFVAACNANDAVPQYFQTGKYQPKQSIATISNAMDVGDPSNFVRVLELFQSDSGHLQEIISTYSISDEHTKLAIGEVFHKNGYVMDPHGAVAYASLKKYLQQHPGMKGIFLETAHPVKFRDLVEQLTGKTIDVPASIARLLNKEKRATRINADYRALEEYLLNNV
ncbi:MAG TPA: threonine synthase [Chitinophagaceae bacterium]|nr:threonine synthase [Chitinophagaceae bacterium]